MKHLPDAEHAHRGLTRFGWIVFAGFGAVALFFLLTEHAAHLYGVLPFLLVAACPLMHFFHHRGHHDHHADSGPAGRPATPSDHGPEPKG